MWIQNSEELFHYGVKGMRWGVRRSRAQLSKSKSSSSRGLFKFSKKKKKNIKETTEKPTKKKSVKDMTDDELSSAIKRLEMEKKYSDLASPAGQKNTFDGKKFVMNVLEKSGESLATQVVNEIGAKAINKAFGYEAVYANNKKK